MRMSIVCHQEIMQSLIKFLDIRTSTFLSILYQSYCPFKNLSLPRLRAVYLFFLAGQAKVARVKKTTRVTEGCRPRFSPCRLTLARAYTLLTKSEKEERLLAVYCLSDRHYIKQHQFVYVPGNQKMNSLGYLLPLWLSLAICRGQCLLLLLLLLLLIQNISPFLIGSNPPPDSS